MMTASMRLTIKKDPMKTMAVQKIAGRKNESCNAKLYIICDQLSSVII